MAIKAASTLTTKGQFTLPVDIRQALDLRPGDELRFELSDDNELSVAPRRRRSIFELRETMPALKLGRPPAQADIDGAVAEALDEQEERVARGA